MSLEAWSYSALNHLLRICSAQFLFQRIAGLEPAFESPNLVLGRSVHHAAAYIRARQMRGELATADDAREVFVESFDILSSNPVVRFEEGEAEAIREQGLLLVDLLHAHIGDEEVIAVEQEFEVPLVDEHGVVVSELPLRGYIDLVVREPEGRVVVVDVKTSGRRYSQARVQSYLQATVYAWAARQLYGDVGFRFDVLVKTRKPQFQRLTTARGPQDFARFLSLVKVAERMVEADAYAPADGWCCPGCGYRTACRAWSADSTEATSEAA